MTRPWDIEVQTRIWAMEEFLRGAGADLNFEFEGIVHRARDGAQLSAAEAMVLAGEESYRRIGYDCVEGYTVSTVWLGSVLARPGEVIRPFETLVFPGEGPEVEYDSLSGQRWASETEARTGHAETLAALRMRLAMLEGEIADLLGGDSTSPET